eukprot:s371_g19.t1
MKTLGQWKELAESSDIRKLQQEHETLSSNCAKKLGRKPRTALMEVLGKMYNVEDKAVPLLCLTGMPIVGKALESPFFYPFHVPAAVTIAELLKSAPLRRSSTLKRVRTMAESGSSEMADAIWRKTLKEVDAGTMSGPYSFEAMLEKHGKYLNLVPSFGLKQGEKYRRIDDHSASHNNLAAERMQQIHMAMVDYLMVMISSMAQKFNTGLHVATEDMAGAYRQVPLTDSQVGISVTAVYNPKTKQPDLFEIYGQPFGAAHAVPNFYREAEWACRLVVSIHAPFVHSDFSLWNLKLVGKQVQIGSYLCNPTDGVFELRSFGVDCLLSNEVFATIDLSQPIHLEPQSVGEMFIDYNVLQHWDSLVLPAINTVINSAMGRVGLAPDQVVTLSFMITTDCMARNMQIFLGVQANVPIGLAKLPEIWAWNQSFYEDPTQFWADLYKAVNKGLKTERFFGVGLVEHSWRGHDLGLHDCGSLQRNFGLCHLSGDVVAVEERMSVQGWDAAHDSQGMICRRRPVEGNTLSPVCPEKVWGRSVSDLEIIVADETPQAKPHLTKAMSQSRLEAAMPKGPKNIVSS